MRRTIVKIICDRCGLDITGDPVRITPHLVRRNTDQPYDCETDIVPPEWMKKMMDKEFCTHCAETILDIPLIRE